MPSLDKQRVLMLDDEPDFLAQTRRWLSPFDVRGITDAGRLRAELEAYEPALLVLDVELPGVDGFELCRRVRAEKRWAELPVLFLTGRSAAREILRSAKAGGTAFLEKPISRHQLLTAVRSLIPEPAQDELSGVVD